MMVITEPGKGFFMFARWLSRSILLFTVIGVLSYFCDVAYSREVSIFSVNKNLQMDPKDPVYHDYYISGGSEQGFRTGMQVTVLRRIPVHDLSRNRALGDLRLPVAKLKLIFVQKGMAVGRLLALSSMKNAPIVDYEGVMIGDAISLGDGLDADGIMEVKEEGDQGSQQAPSDVKTSAAPAEIKIESPTSSPTETAPDDDAAAAPLTSEEISKNLMPKADKVDVSSRFPANEAMPAKPKQKSKNPGTAPRKEDPKSENTQLGPKA